MRIRLHHKVIFGQREHLFSVVVECPFPPQPDFLFVFRNKSNNGDDCALHVKELYGWDVTNQELLVRTIEWNIDSWVKKGGEGTAMFEDAKSQLMHVVGCEYRKSSDD